MKRYCNRRYIFPRKHILVWIEKSTSRYPNVNTYKFCDQVVTRNCFSKRLGLFLTSFGNCKSLLSDFRKINKAFLVYLIVKSHLTSLVLWANLRLTRGILHNMKNQSKTWLSNQKIIRTNNQWRQLIQNSICTILNSPHDISCAQKS